MLKKIIFSMLLCLLLSVPAFSQLDSSASEQQPVGALKEEAGLSLQSIDGIIMIVKNESLTKSTLPQLCNGALAGVKEYLKTKKLDASFVASVPAGLDGQNALDSFNRAYNQVSAVYPAVNKEELSYAAVRGLLTSLNDPYAAFMDKKEFAAFQEQMKGGNFGGLGIYHEPDAKNRRITIVDTIEGTPAEEAGLLKGDVILAIDGKPLKDMESIEKAQEMLRGDVGTAVTLTIKRSALEPFDVVITRAIIKAKSVYYKMMDGNVGYVRFGLFLENTGEEFRNALDDLDRQGALSYIVDLRDNGGGYVSAAIQVLSELVPTGSLITTIIRPGDNPETPYTAFPSTRPELTALAVLVNKGSASASEITAGAIQDLEEGAIVGSVTFGKAAVQKVYPLQGGTGMKVTTAQYLTPAKRLIDKKGITPDLVVTQNKQITGEKDDMTLNAAKKYIEREAVRKKEELAAGEYRSAVPIRSNAYKYDYIKNACGDVFEVKSSRLVYSGGRLYDKVRVFCNGGERQFIFDISEMF